MGNMPAMGRDPDGEFFWVAVAIGAFLGGTSQGIAEVAKGGNFLDGFWKGALIGGASAAVGFGVGTWAASGVGSIGGGVVGGSAAGFVGGGLGSAANGGNFWEGAGRGAWQGAITGLVGAGVGTPLANNGYNELGAVLGGAAAGATSGMLNGGDVAMAALAGGIGGLVSYRAATSKAFRQLTPTARRTIVTIARLNKKNNYMNEYLKMIDDKGTEFPILKGEKYDMDKYNEYMTKIIRNNKILFDIHSHPNDNGLSGEDYQTFLFTGQDGKSPNIKTISVGPTIVDMVSGWSPNWTDPGWKPIWSSWSLKLHSYQSIFGFRF
jgi:hypothetical protein